MRKIHSVLASALCLCWSLGAAGSVDTPTYYSVPAGASPRIAALSKSVRSGNHTAVLKFWKTVKKSGAPLIETIPGTDYSLVTFVWRGDSETRNVVIFDGVAGFDAKDRMLHLGNTSIWYKTYRVRNDARFAYSLSPNDSLQSFDDVKGDEAMHARLAMLQPDPLNPRRCPTTFGAYGSASSYVELPNAPGLLWSSSTAKIPRGMLHQATIHSVYLGREKNVFVYTPPGSVQEGARYPLLVLFDGDRNVMWIPKVLDILIAQRRIPPMVTVMTDDSVPGYRRTELPCSPQFADFLAQELVPWAQKNYKVTTQPARTVVAGSSFGGLASVFAGIKHPEVFGNVISLSGSFWWKPKKEQEPEWLVRLVSTSSQEPLRFYLEVGLMENYPAQVIANRHMRDALTAKGYPVAYSEYDGGHSFLNWSQGIANGLEWLLREDQVRASQYR